MKRVWVDAEKDRAVACESAFQNGGPKVYIYDDWKQIPSPHSASYSIKLAGPQQTVYARRKVGQKYVWRKWVEA